MMTARRAPVLQIADVSHPAVKVQGAQRIGRKGKAGLGVLDTIVVQESLRQQDDIVPRFTWSDAGNSPISSRKSVPQQRSRCALCAGCGRP
jgi:hypothetical protein